MFSHFLRKLASLVKRSPGVRMEVGGLLWQVTPAGEQVFGSAGPDLPAWEKAGLVEVVKRNLQRTISLVRLPGGAVYLKHCRANTPRAWAREILRPAKARLEYENALTLRALGVSAIEPLAWGAAPGPLPGDSYLITRAEDAEPFVDYLERGPTGPRQLERAFAEFVAKLHDAGVTHPDPHPGNVLFEPNRVPRFVLADLHAIHFGSPLDWPETLANLVLLNRWFQMRATRTDRLRFWRAYLTARSGCPKADADRMAKAIEAATAASNERFWAARAARHTANNRDSAKVRGPAANGFAVRELPPELIRDWLADPDAVFTQPGVRILKDSRTSTVAELVVCSRAVIYKRFNVKSRLGPLKNLLRPSPALRSWTLGHGVRDRGLPTARPLAVFQRRSFGVPTTGYVVFEKVPDALTLTEAVERVAGNPRVVRAWAERLGRLLRLMHERQVSHHDLKAPNILMAGMSDPLNAEPVLIDLVGVEAGRPVPEAVRIRDLARLNASFLDSSRVTRTDRLRVLRAYRLWSMRGRGDWKSWWTRVAEATDAKVARNAKTGRPLS
jgi:tRNA A-37 threonylcarbamoyl transferase component Bud32